MGEIITSTANPRVKAAVALGRRKEREQRREYLVEGVRPVVELLADDRAERVFAMPDVARQLTPMLERSSAELLVVDERVLRRLAESSSPQGVVAVAQQRRATLDDVLGRGFALVLCAVADPGNAGAVIRTATAAGAAGVVLTRGSVDPFNPKAVRAAAGTIARVPLVLDATAAEVVARCASIGQRTVALDAGATRSLWDGDLLASPVALILGNESHGLPPEVRSEVDAVVGIPRFGPAESLNLAAAAAVAAFAVARVQQHAEVAS